MKNQFQFRAWLFDMVVGGLSEDKIFLEVRAGDPDLYKLVTQQVDQRGNTVTSPKPLQDVIKKTQEEWSNATGPLSAAYQKLHYAELGLRGDLQAELTKLDLPNPHDVRDAVKQAMNVTSREEWGAAGVPSDIDGAIGYLETAGVDVSGLRARMNDLYPVAQPDTE